MPLLIFHGTGDRLAAVEGSKRFYSRPSSSDKTLRLCEGLFHEVFNEPEQKTLLDELVKWLDGHTDSPEQAKRSHDRHGGSREQRRVPGSAQETTSLSAQLSNRCA